MSHLTVREPLEVNEAALATGSRGQVEEHLNRVAGHCTSLTGICLDPPCGWLRG